MLTRAAGAPRPRSQHYRTGAVGELRGDPDLAEGVHRSELLRRHVPAALFQPNPSR